MDDVSRGRIYLRHVEAADRAELLDLTRASQHLHHPWIAPPLTELSFNAYLARARSDDHEGLLVCAKDGDTILGVINLNNIVRGSFLSASLGYYVGSTYAGHGFMLEGLSLVKRHAFGTLGLHRLEANIQPENRRSIALVRRAGFEHEGLSRAFLYIDGRWRDHERWCVIHDRTQLNP